MTTYYLKRLKQYDAVTNVNGVLIDVGAPIFAVDYDDALTTAAAMFVVDGIHLSSIYVWEVKT